MNKKLVYFMFIFIGLLFITPSVNASTKTGINIDAHEHFNYYYEQKHGTGFYNFLKNTDFNDYFGTNRKYYINIYYVDDIDLSYFTGSNKPNSIPNNAKYVLLADFSNTTSSGHHTISRDGYNFSYYVHSYDADSCCGSSLRAIEFFDEDGIRLSRISSYNKQQLTWSFTKTYHFDSHSDEDSANFTYMLSSMFHTVSRPNIDPNTEIIITDIIDDGEHFLIDDNDNYSGWLRRILSLWTLDYMSVVDTDLNYFKTNVITNTFPTLKQVLDAGVQLDVPDDFTSLVLDNKHDNYLLIPKDINNSSLNRKFLVATTESRNYSVFRVGVNTYDLNNNYTVPYEENVLQYIRFSQPNKLYVLDINKELRKINENYSLTNYAIGFGLFGNSVKYSANVYYNPSAYTVCLYYGGSNNNSCTFTNPVNNEEITLNNQQMYDILSSTNFSGASSNIFDSVEDQCKTAADYSDLYEYDDDCNIVGVKDNSSGVFESLSNISKFLSSFVAIITTIFSFVILLLDSLPPEIKSVLLFGLIGGTVIMLYKLIRG